MRRRGRTLHHSQTSRVHAKSSSLRRFFGGRLIAILLIALVLSCFLLLLALALLHFDFSALFAVAGAFIVQFIVFGDDLGLAGFAVTATSGAERVVS
jgi:hypothetical protein